MAESGSLSMRERVARIRLPKSADAAPSAGRFNWLPWLLSLLLSFAVVSLAMQPGSTAPAVGDVVPTPAGESTARPSTSGAPGTAAAPKAAPGSVVLESKGYIVPASQIQVSPIEVSGRIVELNIEEGKKFAKGEVLAVLDQSSFEAVFMEAQANLMVAKAALLELQNGSRPEEIAQAEAEWQEVQELIKQAKLRLDRNRTLDAGALSIDELEQSMFAYSSLVQRGNRLRTSLELARIGPRVERIAVAEAEVKVAEARMMQAKWRLDNCTIRAPVSGTILKKSAELGNLVSPLSFNVSASICEMADLGALEVDLEIPERDISRIIVGMPCVTTTDAFPDRRYNGRVDRLMPIALQNKAAIQVRVKLEVPPGEEGLFLKPGMNARVAFLSPGEEAAQ